MRLRLATLAVLLSFALALQAQEKPWPIRAVIVATFEVGNDTGDVAGEFQYWVEREHLTEVIQFPDGVHPLRTNKEHTVLGMVSGTTLINSSASLMALGLDPRFDLTHAYFLINGIAGVDPNVASVGSAAWVRYVVGDVAREIDMHEAPKGWPYGVFPVQSAAPRPADLPDVPWFRSNYYPLNASLAEWAFEKTKDLKLMDDPKVAAFRAGWIGYPEAQKPPFVLLGDTFASDRFWHGKVLNGYAEDWVKLYTKGKGRFAMTEMEDSGFMEAIARLDRVKKIDPRRIMILRTGSNYSMQRPGHDAVESLTEPFIGRTVALESAWLCGSTVLHDILTHWDTTYATVPGR